jgi:hypothetical protein
MFAFVTARRPLAVALAAAAVAASLALLPTAASADDDVPLIPLLKDRLSGPDLRPSAFQSVAADGSLAAAAWQDVGHSGVEEVLVAVSDDQGQTWSSPVNVSKSTYTGSSRPSVAVDGDDVWVAWQEATTKDSPGLGNADIWAAHSPDGGRSWEAPLRVAQDRDDSQWPQIAIHAGRPYVAWAGLDEKLFLATYAGDGSAWTTRRVAAETYPFSEQPRLVEADGRLYLGWHGAHREKGAVGGVHVVAIAADGAVLDVVDVVGKGTIISDLVLDAEGATVAVGWTEQLTYASPRVARAAVSRDGGRSFSDSTSLAGGSPASEVTDVLVTREGVWAAYEVANPGQKGRQQVRTTADGASWAAPMEMPAATAATALREPGPEGVSAERPARTAASTTTGLADRSTFILVRWTATATASSTT